VNALAKRRSDGFADCGRSRGAGEAAAVAAEVERRAGEGAGNAMDVRADSAGMAARWRPPA
jgi:hypothetical protein